MKNIDNARDYLKVHSEFDLGKLLTESQHPMTVGLSKLANEDLPEGFRVFKKVDEEALSIFKNPSDELLEWFQTARSHLSQGGRIFLGGCGATGRLSLGLEFLWKRLEREYRPDQVISLMAGGDVALIASIEKFEDFPEYGARQLQELGFNENDLFVGITEGGETPWVIGATEWASKVSQHGAYFFYCNPDEILINLTTRTNQVLTNPKIKKVNLTCGPMALSGSTRLEASTVLMIGVGMGLFLRSDADCSKWWIDFYTHFEKLSFEKMAPLCEAESNLYKNGAFSFYETDVDFGLTVLTDTTERSPTFSLVSFENKDDHTSHNIATLSWTYLSMKSESTGIDAWNLLLGRHPRALEWEDTSARTGLKRLLGYPVGHDSKKFRSDNLARHGQKLETFKLWQENGHVHMKLGETKASFDLGDNLFCQVMLLKMLLNAHSTLMMGRLGRFESNVMTYVRPSNNKLIDRMARYTLALLNERGVKRTFKEVVEAYYEIRETLGAGNAGAERPVVLTLVDRLSRPKPAVTTGRDTYL